jgi:hypothetical protein
LLLEWNCTLVVGPVYLYLHLEVHFLNFSACCLLHFF